MPALLPFGPVLGCWRGGANQEPVGRAGLAPVRRKSRYSSGLSSTCQVLPLIFGRPPARVCVATPVARYYLSSVPAYSVYSVLACPLALVVAYAARPVTGRNRCSLTAVAVGVVQGNNGIVCLKHGVRDWSDFVRGAHARIGPRRWSLQTRKGVSAPVQFHPLHIPHHLVIAVV